ncbi:uncharacterized protein LOC119894906 [Micropterus salmoides]|uniref:uncharacterized protein LOC119894906 n=1 Tax=Micropterus salmoides TaxID=27706 RepID=UPI0018EAFF69|nr:uncharacterized protein LOC119894906 [Micropterus salmoides]
MLPLTARSLPALVLLFSPPPPLVSSAPAPLSPYLSLFLSLFFFTILCLLQPAHSLCSSRVMRRKRKKKGGGIGVKSRGRFLLVQSQALPPVSASFVCSGCCSGDMAAGFDPDCGNISSVAESGIAVRPGCRYHPSPCHRPKGCWESGRQLPGSDNRGCILIFQHRMPEKPALLLPHHPVWKTINPAIREQSTELSPDHRWLPVVSAPIIYQTLSTEHFA